MLDNETQLRYLTAMDIPVWQLRSKPPGLPTIAEADAASTAAQASKNQAPPNLSGDDGNDDAKTVESCVIKEIALPSSQAEWLAWIADSPLADPSGYQVPPGAAKAESGTWGPSNAELMIVDLPRHVIADDAVVSSGYPTSAARMVQSMLQAIGLNSGACRFACVDRDLVGAPSLQETIRLQPVKVVLVFTFPGLSQELDSLLRSNELHGQENSPLTSDDIRWVVSYHPTYLLDHPDEKRVVWEDLKLVQTFLSTP